MPSVKEIVDQTTAGDDAAHEFPPLFHPLVMAVATEIGDDLVLAEAVLKRVREYKQKFIAAKAGVLYSPEELQAMMEKLEAEQENESSE